MDLLRSRILGVAPVRMRRCFARYIASITRGLTRPQQKFVSDLLRGLLIGRSTWLSDIARALNEPHALIQTEKRLSRNLGSKKLDAERIRANYLSRVRNELAAHIIAVDFSDIQKPHARKLPFLARVRDGSAPEQRREATTGPGYSVLQAEAVGFGGQRLPLWLELTSTNLPDYKSEIHRTREMVTRLKEFVPSNAVWVFDRGFDAGRLYAALDVAQVRYAVRLRGASRFVFLRDAEKPMSADLAAERIQPAQSFFVPTWIGRSKKLKLSVGWATVRLMKYSDRGTYLGKPDDTEFSLVVVRGTGKRPILLLSNIAVRNAKDAVFLAESYLRRWGVEEATRFEKTGLALEDVRVLRWESLRRLCTFVMLAYGFLAVANEQNDDLREAAASVPAFETVPRFLFYRALELAAVELSGPRITPAAA